MRDKIISFSYHGVLHTLSMKGGVVGKVASSPMERGVGTHARPEGPAVRVPTYIFF